MSKYPSLLALVVTVSLTDWLTVPSPAVSQSLWAMGGSPQFVGGIQMPSHTSRNVSDLVPYHTAPKAVGGYVSSVELRTGPDHDHRRQLVWHQRKGFLISNERRCCYQKFSVKSTQDIFTTSLSTSSSSLRLVSGRGEGEVREAGFAKSSRNKLCRIAGIIIKAVICVGEYVFVTRDEHMKDLRWLLDKSFAYYLLIMIKFFGD